MNGDFEHDIDRLVITLKKLFSCHHLVDGMRYRTEEIAIKCGEYLMKKAFKNASNNYSDIMENIRW